MGIAEAGPTLEIVAGPKQLNLVITKQIEDVHANCHANCKENTE